MLLWYFEGYLGLTNFGFAADDPLRNSGWGGKKRAGNLFGSQVAHLTQGHGCASIKRQCRMAAGEDQPKHIIFNFLINLFRRIDCISFYLLYLLYLQRVKF